MKKFAAFALVIMLCMTLVSPACAQQASFSNTQAFIRILDEKEMAYSFKGIDSENYEVIELPFSNDDFDYTVTYFFCDSNELISIRVWNVIDFQEDDLIDVLRAVNSLNYDYNFATFFVDETDNSVTISMDLIVREGSDAADIAWEATCYTGAILEDTYGILAVYAK